MNNIVNQQSNFHIIPFAFEKSFDEVKKKMKLKCEDGSWQCKDMGDVNLLKHINNLISDKEALQSNIGKRYLLMQKGRKDLGLPQNTNAIISFKHKKEKFNYEIRIKDINLFLFETNIGFVIFKFEYLGKDDKDKIDLDTITQINYQLKRLAVNSNTLSYLKKISKDESVECIFRLQDIVDSITKEFLVKTYFDDIEKLISKDEDNIEIIKKINKSIVYSAVLLENPMDKDSIKSRLFQMRRGFKEATKIIEDDIDLNCNNEVVRLFENNYWGISLEGVANIAFQEQGKDLNNFFRSEALVRIENTYLYLYLIVLNMRYSLLYFSLLSSELPKTIDECIGLEEKENKIKSVISISELEEKISFFRLRCVFRIVSSITHQNKIYNAMWKVNNIDILLEELNSEVSALAKMTELRKVKLEKIEKIEKDKQDKIKKQADKTFKDIFIVISLVFTMLSAFGNIEKLVETSEMVVEACTSPLSSKSIIIFVIIIVLIILLVTTLTLYNKYILKSGKGTIKNGKEI